MSPFQETFQRGWRAALFRRAARRCQMSGLGAGGASATEPRTTEISLGLTLKVSGRSAAGAVRRAPRAGLTLTATKRSFGLATTSGTEVSP
jgi:hypothetical protein